MSENTTNFKSFESLKVWQQARKIRNDIFKLCKSFPKEETYKLTDQMIRSARSIGNNIAEGYGRFHYQKNIQFCRQSRGSQYELIDHLIDAMDCGYIEEDECNRRKKYNIESIKMTNGYIAYLHRQKSSNKIEESEIHYQPNDFEQDYP